MRQVILMIAPLLVALAQEAGAAPPAAAIPGIGSPRAPVELVRRSYGGRSYGYRPSRPHWSRHYSIRPRGGRWF